MLCMGMDRRDPGCETWMSWNRVSRCCVEPTRGKPEPRYTGGPRTEFSVSRSGVWLVGGSQRSDTGSWDLDADQVEVVDCIACHAKRPEDVSRLPAPQMTTDPRPQCGGPQIFPRSFWMKHSRLSSNHTNCTECTEYDILLHRLNAERDGRNSAVFPTLTNTSEDEPTQTKRLSTNA